MRKPNIVDQQGDLDCPKTGDTFINILVWAWQFTEDVAKMMTVSHRDRYNVHDESQDLPPRA